MANNSLTHAILGEPRDLTGAIVVGCQLEGQDIEEVEEDVSELASLLATLGIEVKERLMQKRSRPNPSLFLGSGKVDELKYIAAAQGANLIVFDHSLTPPQVRNLEKITECQVFDREAVILEIFGRHARTKQAKLQVEIAQLEYILPRLSGAWSHFQRQTGGRVRSRGMGEKQIEVDRRRARERISRLSRQLEQLAKERKIQSRARQNELRVAIVGYTNSGKTTIMGALTKFDTPPEDALFATLDSSVRTLDPSTRPKILLSDTVGFIRNLPHGLIESFKSTLEEVKESDLLLHIVDLSHENYRKHIQTTQSVLQEIGAGNIPVLHVFNKCDRVSDPHLPKIIAQAYDPAICLSAHDMHDIRRLRRKIYDYFEKHFLRMQVRIPAHDLAALSLVHQHCLISSADYGYEGVVVFDVRAPAATIAKLSPYAMAKDVGTS